MNPRATKIAEGFSAKVLQIIYAQFVGENFINRDYEGEINGVGSVVNILTLGEQDEQDYTGSNLNIQHLTESNAQLQITKKKSFYFDDKTIDDFESYIKNPVPTTIAQLLGKRRKNMEKFIFDAYTDVAAGNRVGVDYTTGTVDIDVDGNVTVASGSPTWTSAMVGRGFKAAGHSKWYRVASVTDSTHLAIEQDLDDETNTYDGGVISGATYTIEAVSPIQLTASNIRQYLGKVKIKFDNAEVPDEDRSLAVPTEIEDLITQGTNILINADAPYQELVKQGFIRNILNMNIFKTTNLTGDNTNGFHCLGAQKNFLTFAEKQLKAQMEEDLIGNFGAAYKDLFVYGKKVADVRRKFGVELYAYV